MLPSEKTVFSSSFNFSFNDACNERLVSSDEKLFFTRPGLQKKKLQKLKKGQIPIVASIDLHNMNSDQALSALKHFFLRRSISSQSCFCIIHGKGQDTPILKNLVNRFLKQEPHVLAFCSAPSNLGGTGATLALLKSLNGSHSTYEKPNDHNRYCRRFSFRKKPFSFYNCQGVRI